MSDMHPVSTVMIWDRLHTSSLDPKLVFLCLQNMLLQVLQLLETNLIEPPQPLNLGDSTCERQSWHAL